jgi:hypothetical protein
MNKRFYIQVSTSDIYLTYMLKFNGRIRNLCLNQYLIREPGGIEYKYATLWNMAKVSGYVIAGFISIHPDRSEFDVINSYRDARRRGIVE